MKTVIMEKLKEACNLLEYEAVDQLAAIYSQSET